MALSSLLDRILGVRRIVDPVFGPLRYRKAGEYWEGRPRFAPAGGTVESFIDAGETGPTEGQREFFQRLADRYPSLYAAMLARAEEGHPSPEGMLLTGIDLPDWAAESGACELTYRSPDGARLFVVVIVDWEPVEVVMGGDQ